MKADLVYTYHSICSSSFKCITISVICVLSSETSVDCSFLLESDIAFCTCCSFSLILNRLKNYYWMRSREDRYKKLCAWKLLVLPNLFFRYSLPCLSLGQSQVDGGVKTRTLACWSCDPKILAKIPPPSDRSKGPHTYPILSQKWE